MSEYIKENESFKFVETGSYKKANIKYSKGQQIDKESESLLKEIASNNDSKWIIALEAYCFCAKQLRESE